LLGIAALVLAVAYCGFIAWRLLRVPIQPVVYPTPHAAELNTVKRDLCRLARAESSFKQATGHYAPETELRSNGDATLPAGTRWPYHYGIYVPVADRFVIVALAYGPLEKRPPAVVADDLLRVCTVSSRPPRISRTLDSLPERWGDPNLIEYHCEPCK
jgi:hypothetical protein